jgi:hypothetical protein
VSRLCGATSRSGSVCDRWSGHGGRHWDRSDVGGRCEWGGSGPSGQTTPHAQRGGERLEVRLGDESSRCLTLLVQRLGGTRRSHVERAIVAEYQRVAR